MSWTLIPDSDVDQDSPLNQPLMTSLRDNPIAIAAGLSGAPRILSTAFDLTYKTGSRTSDGTIVTLDTTDLPNLADMGLALLTGTLDINSDSGASGSISCSLSTPNTLLNVAIGASDQRTHSFSFLLPLSGATSISLTTNLSAGGIGTIVAYGQILILGR